MNTLCRTVMEHLAGGTPLVLATIMDQEGSAPRTAGARMLVRPDASIWGTVGGGIAEGKAIAAAMEMHTLLAARAASPEASHAEQRAPRSALPGQTPASSPPQPAPSCPGPCPQPGRILEFSLRGPAFPGDMDMICGGSLTLLLEALPADDITRSTFTAACAAEEQGQPFVFISRIERFEGAPDGPSPPHDSGEAVTVQRVLFLPGTQDTSPLPPEALEKARGLSGATPRHMFLSGEEYLLEPFPQPYRIHIFGAGHVSLELAKIALGVDFHVTAIDDRPEFAAPQRFPGARTEVAPSMKEADTAAYLAGQNIGPRDGIVIVTRGHAHDRDVLAAALQTGAGYIGMIGSASKRKGVYGSLREAGFQESDFARVHSPIGLSIGAETPQEIAVSIAAELIRWRSGK